MSMSTFKIKKNCESEVMKIYDSESNNYAIFKNKGEKFLAHIERKRILNHILREDTRFTCIIEVGCGWGRYLSYVSNFSDCNVGVDLSKQMLLRLKERFPDSNILVVQADMKNLPFKEGAFDLVYSIRAFKYSPSPFDVLKEINRLTKTSGHAAVYEVNNGVSLAYLTFLIKKTINSNSNWAPISSLVSMKQYFKSAGFSKISCEGVLSLPPVLYSIVKKENLLELFSIIELLCAKIPYFGQFGYGIIYSAKKKISKA